MDQMSGSSKPHLKQDDKEKQISKKVEEYTSGIPSAAYFGLAVGSMILSASIAAFTRRKSAANFIGLWVPTLMLVGVYDKLVKLEARD